MRLMGMRFRDFTWQDNPVSLQVESAKNVAEVRVPYGESRAEELGQQRRKVTGEGYFSGADCMERWAALQRAYAQEGPGRLQLPGLTPFWALMDRLELTGAQGKDLVRYSFSFTEWEGQPAFSGRGTYRAQEGESLWDYANRWGLSIEALVESNPHIPNINELEAGEKVVVP